MMQSMYSTSHFHLTILSVTDYKMHWGTYSPDRKA